MEISRRSKLHGLAPLLAAMLMAGVSLAQPPPRNSSDSGAGAGSVPSPGRPGSRYPKPLGQIALTPSDAPPNRRHDRDSGSSKDSTVAQVQRALQNRGYYHGPVDGAAGPGTRGAIRAFRRERGLGSSTKIDGPLIRALRL